MLFSALTDLEQSRCSRGRDPHKSIPLQHRRRCDRPGERVLPPSHGQVQRRWSCGQDWDVRGVTRSKGRPRRISSGLWITDLPKTQRWTACLYCFSPPSTLFFFFFFKFQDNILRGLICFCSCFCFSKAMNMFWTNIMKHFKKIKGMEINSYKVAEKTHYQHHQLCSWRDIHYFSVSKTLKFASSENPCVEATLQCIRLWCCTKRLWWDLGLGLCFCFGLVSSRVVLVMILWLSQICQAFDTAS